MEESRRGVAYKLGTRTLRVSAQEEKEAQEAKMSKDDDDFDIYGDSGTQSYETSGGGVCSDFLDHQGT